MSETLGNPPIRRGAPQNQLKCFGKKNLPWNPAGSRHVNLLYFTFFAVPLLLPDPPHFYKAIGRCGIGRGVTKYQFQVRRRDARDSGEGVQFACNLGILRSREVVNDEYIQKGVNSGVSIFFGWAARYSR